MLQGNLSKRRKAAQEGRKLHSFEDLQLKFTNELDKLRKLAAALHADDEESF